MCKICQFCGRWKECPLKRKSYYRRRKRRAVTQQRVQKKYKTRLPARAVKKKARKIHAGTQPDEAPRKSMSPLCVGFGRPHRAKKIQLTEHSQITPEMIYQTVKQLSLWRTSVEFNNIMKYILSHYPVNRNRRHLREELNHKLQVAQLVGMVCTDNNGRWTLHNSLEGLRQIPKALVSLFWEMYCNTMDPLQIQPQKAIPVFKDEEHQDSDSDSLPSVENFDTMV